MADLRLETNDDGLITGLRLTGVEEITTSDGSLVFYADKISVKNSYDMDSVSVRELNDSDIRKLLKK